MRVMVFGTFDIFHPGHRNMIKQARKFGDELIVVVATDENVMKNKGKKPLHNQQERINAILDSGLVDRVVPGKRNNVFQVVEETKPDVICLGYDQKFYIDKLKAWIKQNKTLRRAQHKNLIKIFRMKPYKHHIYKSSLIIKKNNMDSTSKR